jgi:hypothetical protein
MKIFSSCIFLPQFLVIKTLDLELDPVPNSLEMLHPDPHSDPDSMNPDPQHCHAAFIFAFVCYRYMVATLYIHLQIM